VISQFDLAVLSGKRSPRGIIGKASGSSPARLSTRFLGSLDQPSIVKRTPVRESVVVVQFPKEAILSGLVRDI
jgi:hypothetical protein